MNKLEKIVFFDYAFTKLVKSIKSEIKFSVLVDLIGILNILICSIKYKNNTECSSKLFSELAMLLSSLPMNINRAVDNIAVMYINGKNPDDIIGYCQYLIDHLLIISINVPEPENVFE